MTPERALRWSRIWWFLSLDLTADLEDELWLTKVSQEGLSHIRSTIQIGSDLPTYGSDPRRSVYARLREFRKKFGLDALEHLLWWERSVFINGGADRVSEFLWQMAICTRPVSLKQGSTILAAFDSVRRTCDIQGQLFQEKVARKTHSARDRALIEAEGSSGLEVLELAKGIATTNAFAQAWHSEATTRGLAFLEEAFAAVSSMPPSANPQFDPESIAFPSSWEFDLRLGGGE
jgi:hypothetical protein